MMLCAGRDGSTVVIASRNVSAEQPELPPPTSQIRSHVATGSGRSSTPFSSNTRRASLHDSKRKSAMVLVRCLMRDFNVNLQTVRVIERRERAAGRTRHGDRDALQRALRCQYLGKL